MIPQKKSLDLKCYELAKYFLSNEPLLDTEENRNELALVVQRLTEDWIEYFREQEESKMSSNIPHERNPKLYTEVELQSRLTQEREHCREIALRNLMEHDTELIAQRDAEVAAAYACAAKIIRDEIGNREKFENHLESLDCLAEQIDALTPTHARAALANLRAEVAQDTLSELERNGKDLVIGCGEPFRVFSEAALAAMDAEIRKDAIAKIERKARLDEAK